MRRRLWIKIGAILLATGLSIYLFYPPKEKIRLGLDLKGGIHLVLQVVTKDAIEAEIGQQVDRIAQDLRDKQIPFDAVERVGELRLQIKGVPADKEGEVRDYLDASGISRAYETMSFMEGGKATWRLTMRSLYKRDLEDMTVRQALETIRARVDALGVAEPTIQIFGSGGQDRVADRIIVELPGIDDPGRVKEILRTTAQLELKLVHPEKGGPYSTRQEAAQAFGGNLPPDYEILPYVEKGNDESPGFSGYMVLRKTAAITGKYLKNARQSYDRFNRPIVNFYLNPEGAQIFGRVTEQNIGKRLAIVLDHRIWSAPVIQSKITDAGEITGLRSLQEAQDLALVLRSGALPASLLIQEERVVGPSLGLDSIRQGVTASIIGFVLVVLTMLTYYRLSGLNAILALALNLVILFGAMAYFGATLTLPGIAGIALTVGMAVDANVLIFERIKEELRAGKTIKSAVEAGFSKAFSAIFDSNVTTLIAAAFLYGFGTGPIRGFAVTLTVGLIANLFTAVWASRVVFEAALATRRIERLSI